MIGESPVGTNEGEINYENNSGRILVISQNVRQLYQQANYSISRGSRIHIHGPVCIFEMTFHANQFTQGH